MTVLGSDSHFREPDYKEPPAARTLPPFQISCSRIRFSLTDDDEKQKSTQINANNKQRNKKAKKKATTTVLIREITHRHSPYIVDFVGTPHSWPAGPAPGDCLLPSSGFRFFAEVGSRGRDGPSDFDGPQTVCVLCSLTHTLKHKDLWTTRRPGRRGGVWRGGSSRRRTEYCFSLRSARRSLSCGEGTCC